MKKEDGRVYLEIGDAVVDAITGTELTITDIFSREGNMMVECTDGRGSTTTVLPKYLKLKK